ncbi:MAG: DUF1491 family protein [Alphaproteobacteria bacterium]|nr:DUF1491 family protein [Alphaproteobacteria bacterium]
MTPRLKSRLWVEALLRRCQIEGKFGAVLQKGAEEAGAVFVVVNHLDGGHDVLCPPPGPALNEEGERWFIKQFASPAPWPQVQEWLARQKKFDADFWVVEVEDRTGLAGLLLARH